LKTMELFHKNDDGGCAPQVSAATRASSAIERFIVRLLWLFVLIAIVATYDPWIVIPWVNTWISPLVDTPLTRAAEWVGQYCFHLSGIAITDHPTDSRDTALGWVSLMIFGLLALTGSILWSVLSRRSKNREVEYVWMRYLLRLMLVFIMLRYGIFKIIPLQMSPPSLAVLNEPLGESSPMTLLWTLIGLRPAYQMISGLLEATCAILLFFRRTALIGTIVGLVVMANVVLLNLCFDVPVKLGAMLIFLAFAVLLGPDLRELFQLFWNHAPAQLKSQWEPAWKSRRTARVAGGLKWVYLILSVYFLLPPGYRQAEEQASHLRHPSPFTGEWELSSATMNVHGQPVNAPILTAEGSPLTALYLEPNGSAMARSQDGRLWRAAITIDSARHQLSLFSYLFDGVRFNATYIYSQPDRDHLRLEPFGKDKDSNCTVLFTRVPLPVSYPLLNTGFQWVEEWALER
jgi:hypothetical protein